MNQELALPDLPDDMEWLIVTAPVRRPESAEARQAMERAAREAVSAAVH